MSDWFYCDVAFVYTHGLMIGIAQGQFAPGLPITRGMVARTLYNRYGQPSVAGLQNPFDDVLPGQWYTNAVIWAYHNGFVHGFGDGTYRPSDFITRAHLALLFCNYATETGVELPVLRTFQGFTTRAELAAFLHRFFYQ